MVAAGGPAQRLRESSGGDVRQATAALAACFLDGVPG
jgi:hypothetical protein